MNPKIDLIHFSIKGEKDQTYYYIPSEKGTTTQVYVHTVLYLDEASKSSMKKFSTNKIIITIGIDNEEKDYPSKDIPIDQLSIDSFINLNVNFKLENKTGNLRNIRISLSYQNNENEKKMFFNTSIPVISQEKLNGK